MASLKASPAQRPLTALWVLCCLLVGSHTFVGAQTLTPSKKLSESLEQLKTIYPEVHVSIDEKSGLPSSITHLNKRSEIGLLGEDLEPKKSPEQVVMEFFKGWGPGLLKMQEPRAEIRILGKKPDSSSSNKVLVRVQQVSGKLDILGAEAVAVVNVDSSSLDSINLDFVTPPAGTHIPKVEPTSAAKTASDAYKLALSASDQNKTLESAIAGSDAHPSPPRLVFAKFPEPANAENGTRLCYFVQVGTYVFLVDALETGKIIDSYRELIQIQVRYTYDSNLAPIVPGVLVLSQDTDVVAASEIPQDARSVHAFASDVYEYYLSKFNRDGYGGGSNVTGAFESCVRFPAMNNALWVPLIQKTLYAPGFATALDIAGHEWTHAVIEHEVRLGLKNEPGALNESLADFFGVMVRAHKTGVIDWKIGTTVVGHIPPNPPIRDLSNPHGIGFDKNKPSGPANSGGAGQYKELVRDTDPICHTPDGSDNGCVHIDGAIFSKALQLATDGGDYLGVHVVKDGSTKVEKIVYTAMTRMTPDTSLAKGALLVVQVCQELETTSTLGIAPSDCKNLVDAFNAVGLTAN